MAREDRGEEFVESGAGPIEADGEGEGEGAAAGRGEGAGAEGEADGVEPTDAAARHQTENEHL